MDGAVQCENYVSQPWVAALMSRRDSSLLGAVEFGGWSRSADPELMLFTEYDTMLTVLATE